MALDRVSLFLWALFDIALVWASWSGAIVGSSSETGYGSLLPPLNPSNAEATFAQSIWTQTNLKNI